MGFDVDTARLKAYEGEGDCACEHTSTVRAKV